MAQLCNLCFPQRPEQLLSQISHHGELLHYEVQVVKKFVYTASSSLSCKLPSGCHQTLMLSISTDDAQTTWRSETEGGFLPRS